MSSRITKKKVKTFLTLRFRKEPMMMYDDTLDVAVEVIQDFFKLRSNGHRQTTK
jgi:hypothetical protein